MSSLYNSTRSSAGPSVSILQLFSTSYNAVKKSGSISIIKMLRRLLTFFGEEHLRGGRGRRYRWRMVVDDGGSTWRLVVRSRNAGGWPRQTGTWAATWAAAAGRLGGVPRIGALPRVGRRREQSKTVVDSAATAAGAAGNVGHRLAWQLRGDVAQDTVYRRYLQFTTNTHNHHDTSDTSVNSMFVFLRVRLQR